MKKFMAIFVAFLVAVGAVICTERVHTGYVGVVYSAKGVEQQTISQGWHFMSPLKHVSVEVMYYDDGHQELNTYMVKAQDQNDAINKAHHRFEKSHPGMSCMVQSAERAGG